MLWIPAVFLFLRIWGTLRFLLYVSGVDYTIFRRDEKGFATFGRVLLYLQVGVINNMYTMVRAVPGGVARGTWTPNNLPQDSTIQSV